METRPLRWLPVVCLLAGACIESDLKGQEVVPQGPAPDILVDPPALAFGAVPMGESLTLPFTVTNIGDGALDVEGIAVISGSSVFELVEGNFEFTLAPEEEKQFEVTYTPNSSQAHYGAIQVESNDPDGNDSSVDLLGEGLAPDILVEPSLLEWSNIPRGDVAVQTFMVSNVGEAVLHVSDIQLVTGADFALIGSFSFELAPGDSTSIDVSFSPQGSGLVEGLVQVVSDDPDGEHSTVDLRGQGLVPDLEITPATYAFSDAFVPCGDTVELTLSNVGGDDLVINDLAYGSSGMLLLDDSGLSLPLTLAPGQTTTVEVQFAPTSDGADAGTLSVTSNDPDGVETATQTANALWVASTSEVFTAPAPPPVDIVITIDQSCSMEQDNVDDVQQGFPGFVAELQNIADWRLILVTDDDGCAATGVLDNNTPNASQILVDNAFPNRGYNINSTEALLDLSELALSKTGPGGCNQNFLRPGALLHSIMLSDEQDRSGNTPAYWVSLLEGYVTDPALLKISGVLDLTRSCGDGTGASGYIDAINLTGGAALDICNASWGDNFDDIASDVLDIVPVYPLSAPADPSTITVEVNGVPTTSISYDAALRQVTVNDPPIVDLDVVEVFYSIPGTCP